MEDTVKESNKDVKASSENTKLVKLIIKLAVFLLSFMILRVGVSIFSIDDIIVLFNFDSSTAKEFACLSIAEIAILALCCIVSIYNFSRTKKIGNELESGLVKSQTFKKGKRSAMILSVLLILFFAYEVVVICICPSLGEKICRELGTTYNSNSGTMILSGIVSAVLAILACFDYHYIKKAESNQAQEQKKAQEQQ